MKIGIDIGGSHIGMALIKDEEMIVKKEKNFSQEEQKNMQVAILKTIQELVSQLQKEYNFSIQEIELMGIAAPGTISNGVIVKAGNLNLKNFNLIQELQKQYPISMQLRNDGKCAALAEKKYGAMKMYDDCVFINIGTGIGGAAFLGGKLLEPKKNSGFEFGHMVLNQEGRLCSCGKKGCFETYSSIKALKLHVTEALQINSDISGKQLREELLIKDDSKVKQEIAVFLEYLKTGIGNLIDIFEPEVVCFGGSFAYYEGSEIWNQFMEKMQESAAIFNEKELPVMVPAKLKNDAGMIGSVIT